MVVKTWRRRTNNKKEETFDVRRERKTRLNEEKKGIWKLINH